MVVQVNPSLVMRIGQNWHLKLVHFLWTLVEKLLIEVDFLGVSGTPCCIQGDRSVKCSLWCVEFKVIQNGGLFGFGGRCGAL